MKYIIFSDINNTTVTNSLEELSKNHEIISTQFTTDQCFTSAGYIRATTYSVLVHYKLKD